MQDTGIPHITYSSNPVKCSLRRRGGVPSFAAHR
jgi:hypothetical protein